MLANLSYRMYKISSSWNIPFNYNIVEDEKCSKLHVVFIGCINSIYYLEIVTCIQNILYKGDHGLFSLVLFAATFAVRHVTNLLIV